MNCMCSTCLKQCKFRPGWFAPDEVEKAAKYLHMGLEEFFYSFLAVDWDDVVMQNGEVIFLLAPALKDSHSGVEYPSYPSGECSFFRNGRCDIYPVRPIDCRIFDHTVSQKWYREKRYEIALSWKEHHNMIEELLGRPPQAKPVRLDDIVKHMW